MVADNDERWRQQLREQLLQRNKDDTQVQRRWEKHMRQRRSWPESSAVDQPDKQKQVKKEPN